MEARHKDRLTENFQTIIDEAHTDGHSAPWHKAVDELKAIHADLPDVASLAARNLPAANNGMIAQRLANTSIREVGAIGRNTFDDPTMELVIRRTHRSVLLQESANQILSEQEGVKNAGDFMKLRQALSPDMNPGKIAIAALDKQGIDARRLLRNMEPAELKAVSVGAYDRINSEGRDKIAGALEITTSESQKQDATREVRGEPVMRAQRTQFAAPPRHATFGRKIAARHQPAESMSM